jgi:hypothetical protein
MKSAIDQFSSYRKALLPAQNKTFAPPPAADIKPKFAREAVVPNSALAGSKKWLLSLGVAAVGLLVFLGMPESSNVRASAQGPLIRSAPAIVNTNSKADAVIVSPVASVPVQLAQSQSILAQAAASESSPAPKTPDAALEKASAAVIAANAIAQANESAQVAAGTVIEAPVTKAKPVAIAQTQPAIEETPLPASKPKATIRKSASHRSASKPSSEDQSGPMLAGLNVPAPVAAPTQTRAPIIAGHSEKVAQVMPVGDSCARLTGFAQTQCKSCSSLSGFSQVNCRAQIWTNMCVNSDSKPADCPVNYNKAG